MIMDRKYRIGIDEMDRQHALWIDLIERFRAVAAEHLMDQVGLGAARVALDELLSYTRTHFGSEEELMKRHGYPGLAEHARKHREMAARLGEMRAEITRHETMSTPLKLNLMANVWLLEHILQEDADYARFILAKASP